MPRAAKVPLDHKKKIAAELREIASKIRSRRKALGWTQEELAERLDCEVTTIQAYEQLRRTPSLPSLLMLCRILKLRIKIE